MRDLFFNEIIIECVYVLFAWLYYSIYSVVITKGDTQLHKVPLIFGLTGKTEEMKTTSSLQYNMQDTYKKQTVGKNV